MSLMIKKWFNLLASDNTPGENLKSLLRPYEIIIDKRLYDVIDSLVIRYIEVCYIDPTTIEDQKATDPEKKFPYTEQNSPFSLDMSKLRSSANALLNMSLMDAVSDIWNQFGVKIESSKNGPAVRKIKLCRAYVKERLIKRINQIISDFETTLHNLQDLKEGKLKNESEDTSVEKEKDSISQE